MFYLAPLRKAMREEAAQLKRELKEAKRRREAEIEEFEARERSTYAPSDSKIKCSYFHVTAHY